jgi:hypothetical protein
MTVFPLHRSFAVDSGVPIFPSHQITEKLGGTKHPARIRLMRHLVPEGMPDQQLHDCKHLSDGSRSAVGIRTLPRFPFAASRPTAGATGEWLDAASKV